MLLWATIAGGALVTGWSLVAMHRGGGWLALLPFLALAVIAERLQVQVYEANQQRISLSFTIAVTMAAVTVQPLSAPLVSLVAGLVHVLGRRQRSLDKVLFNLTNPAVAAMAASGVYLLLRPAETAVTAWHLAAALVAVVTFYAANVGGNILMISLHTGRSLPAVLRETSWFGPTNIVLGLTGAFLGAAHDALGLLGVIMFIVPVLVMRFTLVFYARQSQQTIASLQMARAEAEAAVHAREEFLAIASHELKTPLTTVKGYVQLLSRALQRPPLNDDLFAQYVGQLSDQVVRLETLVSDLLDSSRLQQGQLDLHAEPTDLVALARQVVVRFEHAPERQPGHTLMVDAPAPVVGLWDTSRLDQVLTNLMSNALKYSPAGGDVRVRVWSTADQAELAVSDQGIGIAAADQATLFQPFARASASQRNVPGVGLGLYIAAQIVERHGGSLRLESAPGAGSTFFVRLPLAAPPAAFPSAPTR